MNIKWENNSRVQRLYAEGKINREDIIKRTQSDNFPMEAATVRLAKVREKKPFVTIHIKGEVKKQTNANGYSWKYAPVCRINLGGPHSNAMCPNGDLDENYSWQDVHNIVTRVKEVMDIN